MKKQSPKFKGTRKIVHSNEERMEQLGVQDDPLYRLYQDLGRSPLQDGEIANRFSDKMDRKLGDLEWRKAMHGDGPVVPQFDPETSVLVGHTVREGIEYRIPFDDLTTHALLGGASGSGKTTAASNFLNALAGKVRTILLDHKTEGLRFVRKVEDSVYIPLERQRWNCLAGAAKQRDYIQFLAAQLTRLLAFVPGTANAVLARLSGLCCGNELPAIADLPAIFANLARKEGRIGLHTASKGFEDIATAFGDWGKVREGHWPFDDHALNVIPLKDVPVSMEHFYISLLFKQLTDRAMSGGHAGTLRRIVYFEEGRGFFGREMEAATASRRVNLQADILTKTRSYGIGNIIGTQSISSIQQTVLDNAGTFLALKTNSEAEGRACCRRLGLDESRYFELLEMDVGTAWVVSPRCPKPVKIRIPFNDLGGYPGEAEIAGMMEPVWSAWDAAAVFSPERTVKDERLDFRELLGEKEEPKDRDIPGKTDSEQEVPSTERPSDPVPDDPEILFEYYALLHSCKDNPDLSVSAHYRSLGWSAGRGTRIKESLIELGWIESAVIKTSKAGRPCMRLHPTATGLEVLHESE
ncbi:type IV secretion system DNA-binding domain-containing protein [Pontiellaceae bacterium B12227]|nr:type IV secretion system DNA-binding domain-containing protein [Pontiellaceae bacterium B12227]